MAKINIPVEFTEKYTKDMEAVKDCIEFGHDLKFESCSVFGHDGYMSKPLFNVIKRCKRCGFGIEGMATSKERAAILLLNLK